MLSDTFKQDFNKFLNSEHTAADFMIFLKYHPEARVIISAKFGDWHHWEFMSDDDIHAKYDHLSNNIDPLDNFDYSMEL